MYELFLSYGSVEFLAKFIEKKRKNPLTVFLILLGAFSFDLCNFVDKHGNKFRKFSDYKDYIENLLQIFEELKDENKTIGFFLKRKKKQ